jgi:integrase/recombinase XerD
MVEDIRLFLNYLAKEKKCSKNTLDAYNNDLSQLVEYLSSLPDQDVNTFDARLLDEERMKLYMQHLKEKNYKLSTIARKIAAARTFLRFMAERGRVKESLTEQLASPRINKQMPRALTVQDIRRVLDESARLPTSDGRRDRAMLELLYATGMLASELMALNVDDFDAVAGTITVNSQKEKKRVIKLDKRVSGMIKEYIEVHRINLLSDEKQKALFLNQRGDRLTRQGFWQIVQNYADLAGLTVKVTPRAIRHSYAVHKLNAGEDVHLVQEVLGHAHVSTTKVYKQG